MFERGFCGKSEFTANEFFEDFWNNQVLVSSVFLMIRQVLNFPFWIFKRFLRKGTDRIDPEKVINER